MNTTEAIETLTHHNRWRRGDDSLYSTDPKQLGIAIEHAIAVMEAAKQLIQPKTDFDCFVTDHQSLIDAMEGNE